MGTGKRLTPSLRNPFQYALPDVGDRFITRYLEPVKALGSLSSAVERSVVSYFDHGLKVESAARTLGLHHNTVRHLN